jgi:putative FmdB family regulatory protein
MPIYEFYCARCHRVFHFLSRSVNTDRRPACPACGQAELSRRPSLFAISRGRAEPAEGGLPDLDESRLEKAMSSLAAEGEELNEEDPRQAARLMRKVFEATGMPMNAGMAEAMRRLEAGENPDKIEEEMGDVFEGDPLASGPARPARGLRRLLPPSVDPTLYEM